MKRYRLIMALTLGMLCFFSMMGADNGFFWYEGIEYWIISEEEKTVDVFSIDPDIISIDIPEIAVDKDTGEAYTVKSIFSLSSSLSKLESVKLPKTVTEIFNQAFVTTYNLKQIDVSPENPYFSSYGGVLYDKDMKTLVGCGGGKKQIDFPESVTDIGPGAFSGYNFNSIELPICISTIEEYAFQHSIITGIRLPANLTYLGDHAFLMCQELESVELPASLSELQYDTFSMCSSLRTVICKAVIPPTGAERAFPEWHREWETLYIGNCTLYVPSESLELYKEAEGWKNFGKICAMEETGVNDFKVDNESSFGIYDLHGRRIGSNADSELLKALPKGIYIVNGKKIAL